MGTNSQRRFPTRAWSCAFEHRWFACGLVAGAAGLVVAQEAQFRGLGLLPVGYPSNSAGNCFGNVPGNGPGNTPGNDPPNFAGTASWAYDLSADGNTVVGRFEGCPSNEAYLWTPTNGMSVLPGDSLDTSAHVASADGRIVYGRGTYLDGAATIVWTDGVGPEALTNSLTGAVLTFTPTAVSDNGQILLGTDFGGSDGNTLTTFHWMRFSPSTTGMYTELVPSFGNTILASVDAHSMTAAGDLIAGTSRRPALGGGIEQRAQVWFGGGPGIDLENVNGSLGNTIAEAFTGAGTIVYGFDQQLTLPGGIPGAGWPVAWTSPSPPIPLDPTFQTFVANYDGRVLAGVMFESATNSLVPAIWTVSEGMRPFVNVVSDDGAVGTLTGWQITKIVDVSSDGLTFVGNGLHNGQPEAWWYRRPTCPCVADFDRSGGSPDSTDIAAFFDTWLTGDPSADSDCSGGTPDSTDIELFFSEWLAGGC